MRTDAMRAAGFPRGEVKFLAHEVRPIGQDGLIAGYASLFGVPDLGRDVVERGAFSESLARRGPLGVRMLWQHDPGEPVGRWLSLQEDGRGLLVRGRLNLSVRRAREIAALIGERALDGLSIGFRVIEAAKDRRTGLRRLLKLDLWEISIVTFPMLPGARVGAVKERRVSFRAGRSPDPEPTVKLGRPVVGSGFDAAHRPGMTALTRSIRRAAARLSSPPQA